MRILGLFCALLLLAAVSATQTKERERMNNVIQKVTPLPMAS
jgi:hypothetical protein